MGVRSQLREGHFWILFTAFSHLHCYDMKTLAMTWKCLDWYKNTWIDMKTLAMTWKHLHWYEKNLDWYENTCIDMKKLALIWRHLHWFENACIDMKILALIWKSLQWYENIWTDKKSPANWHMKTLALICKPLWGHSMTFLRSLSWPCQVTSLTFVRSNI